MDLRAPERDFWADEAALWDRLTATWAGLDDAAWHLPGAAPSDAGGPDWSLAEHVGHLAAWQELADRLHRDARSTTGRWPTDDDYDGGDFDTFNERLREPWASMPRDAILDAPRRVARPPSCRVAHRLSPAEIRADAPWGWVYMTLHGHYLDHLAVIEPWTDALRGRQIDGDPFVDDPRAADHADVPRPGRPRSRRTSRRILAADPAERRDGVEVTPGWTVARPRRPPGRLGRGGRPGDRRLPTARRSGSPIRRRASTPGTSGWSRASRGETPATRRSTDTERARAALLDAVDTLTVDELRSPDGWSWAYDCLHGHVRKHLAMLGPWCARPSLAGPDA